MSGGAPRVGSRFLYEPFECAKPNCAPGHSLEAYERVMAERWIGLERRLASFEALIQRLEKRLWLTIVGVAGGVLAEAAQSVLMNAP